MPGSGSTSRPQRENTVGAVVFVAALTLYIATLAPSYLWGDPTKLLFYVLDHHFIGLGPGYGTHPLHNVLGYIFSFLPFSFAYSQNLLSAWFAAAAVYLVFRIIMETFKDLFAALAAAASMAVSHVFWFYAVINESYSLLSFFTLLAMFLCLKWINQPRDWHLYALGATVGAGLANHALLVLAFPGFLALLWGKALFEFAFSWRIAVVFLAFLAGSCQIFLIPIIESGSLTAFVAKLVGDTSNTYQTFSGPFLKLIKELGASPLYLLYQFPGFAIVLGALGLVMGFQRCPRLILSTVLIALLVLLFTSQYMKQRQFPMLIVTFSMFALWVGAGTSCLLDKFPRLRSTPICSALLAGLVLFPPAVYYSASRIAEAVKLDVSFIRTLPYRNSYSYYLFPPKNRERGPQKYAADAFRQAKTGALILADFNPGLVLVYEQRVMGQRKDLEIGVYIDGWIHYSSDPTAATMDFLREQVVAKSRILYLADDWNPYYHSAEIRKEFHLERVGGPLWEVTARGKPSPSD